MLRIVVKELRCGKLFTPEGLILVVNNYSELFKKLYIVGKHKTLLDLARPFL